MSASLSRYEIFLKVAELGNITLAAEALNYTQSGVSHAVAAVEREAGCLLFHRSKTGVTLTDSGTRLIPLMQQLVSRQHALDQAMDALSSRVAGTLRLGSFTSFTATHIPGIIKKFTSIYPDVNIELVNAAYRDIEKLILDGRLDCGFMTGAENPALTFIPLMSDEMLAISAPGHSLAGKSHLALAELSDYELISQFKGSDHDVKQIFKRAGIRPQTKYILDDDISVMGMVAQSDAIALIPEMMLRTAGFDLISRPLEPRQYRTVGLAAPPLGETAYLVRTFAEFCKSYF